MTKNQCVKCPKCNNLNDLSKVSDSATSIICEKCKVESSINELEVIDFGGSEPKKKEMTPKKTPVSVKKVSVDRVVTVSKTGSMSPAPASGKPKYEISNPKNYPKVRVGVDTDHLTLNSTKELRLALTGEGEIRGAKSQKLQGMGNAVKEQFEGVSAVSLAKMVSCFQIEFVKSEKTKNPMAYCTPSSIAFSMIEAGKAGIYPDGKNGALIVRQNYKTKQPELTFMPMAQGIQKAAMASGVAKKFNVQLVYEEDLFKVKKGENGGFIIEHEIDFSGNQQEIIAAYCEIFLTNGEIIIEILRKNDIETFKQKYDKGGESPWAEWGGEMIRKSVVKRACKYLPSAENINEIITEEQG